MAAVDARDRQRIERINASDADGFWNLVQENRDDLKWCGSSPFYTFLKTAPDARGELLRYEQWNIDDNSVVSFAGMAFTQSGRTEIRVTRWWLAPRPRPPWRRLWRRGWRFSRRAAAFISFCIFIASTTTIPCPASTASPAATSTRTTLPGMGAATFCTPPCAPRGRLAAPAARIAHFDLEAVAADGDDAVFHARVVAAAIEQHRVDAGLGISTLDFALGTRRRSGTCRQRVSMRSSRPSMVRSSFIAAFRSVRLRAMRLAERPRSGGRAIAPWHAARPPARPRLRRRAARGWLTRARRTRR